METPRLRGGEMVRAPSDDGALALRSRLRHSAAVRDTASGAIPSPSPPTRPSVAVSEDKEEGGSGYGDAAFTRRRKGARAF